MDEELKPAQNTKLIGVNICYCHPDKAWRFELNSTDGTCWSIESNMSKDEAIERAEEFAIFSGLPMTVHGERWCI